MAKAKNDGAPEVLKDVVVTQNLKVDPNDPRLVKPAEALPSLDDEDQK